MYIKKRPTSESAAAAWDVVMPLLVAMAEEFKDLSKKKSDGASNRAKIAIANRLLGRCREILADEPWLQYLDLFDEDDLPNYSDVALMLSQYVASMHQFRAVHQTLGEWIHDAQ